MPDFEIKPIEPEQTHELRKHTLRPTQHISEMEYPGDRDPATLHVGGFADGKLVAIASIYNEAFPETDATGDWRLRGMAVEPAFQGTGIGRQLLKTCIDQAKAQGGTRFWCNARTPAVGFYERFGMTQSGETFDIVAAGPHVVMSIEL